MPLDRAGLDFLGRSPFPLENPRFEVLDFLGFRGGKGGVRDKLQGNFDNGLQDTGLDRFAMPVIRGKVGLEFFRRAKQPHGQNLQNLPEINKSGELCLILPTTEIFRSIDLS